jgi:hypothetical protein
MSGRWPVAVEKYESIYMHDLVLLTDGACGLAGCGLE